MAEKQYGANGMYYTYNDFLQDVYKMFREMKGHWRIGQCFFNSLRDRRPALAEQLRSHALDPFHKEVLSDELHAWMRSNW